MKKIPKKMLGFFGLILVVVMTLVAAALPSTGVLATSSTTETIVVRVVGVSPNVAITEPEDSVILIKPKQRIAYNYENVVKVTLVIDLLDKDGKLHAYIIDDFTTTEKSGSGTIDLDLSEDRFGYGEYVIRIFGENDKGVSVEDARKFSYHPFTATLEENDETGDPKVVLDYDKDNKNIERFEINIYDKDGKLINPSAIIVTAPNDWANLPFADYDPAKGTYRIEISAFQGETELYKKVNLYYDYEPIPVPDTGSFLRNLNISKADFLISALIIFFAISLGSIVFIVKQKNARK